MNKLAPLVLLGLAALVLAVLFVWLRPDAAREAVPAAAAPRSFEFVLRAGERVSGPELIQVRQGERLRLRITSDQRDEWHLHGYDLALELAPSQPGEVSFTADRSGRFEHELHHRHRALGVLEVLPR